MQEWVQTGDYWLKYASIAFPLNIFLVFSII
uniref:Uncharacterized protein n=1 Tax=Triatoma infestans TaxID=30076 RepID=A0A170XNJ6_TRIIF